MLENINIEATNTTPKVILDYDKGLIELKGRSIPRYSSDFYDPIVKWLDKYEKNPKPVTNIIIELEYYNTGTYNFLGNLFIRARNLKLKGYEIKVTWKYDDEEDRIYDDGLTFAEGTGLNFNMVKIEF